MQENPSSIWKRLLIILVFVALLVLPVSYALFKEYFMQHPSTSAPLQKK